CETQALVEYLPARNKNEMDSDMATAPALAVRGMAWTTPLGDDLESVWDCLVAGRTGLRAVPYQGRLRNGLAGPIDSIAYDLPANERLIQMACSTMGRALAAAGLSCADPDVLLVIGTSLGAYLENDSYGETLYSWAEAVGRQMGAVRPPVALSTACSSGSDAI